VIDPASLVHQVYQRRCAIFCCCSCCRVHVQICLLSSTSISGSYGNICRCCCSRAVYPNRFSAHLRTSRVRAACTHACHRHRLDEGVTKRSFFFSLFLVSFHKQEGAMIPAVDAFYSSLYLRSLHPLLRPRLLPHASPVLPAAACPG
jgi:hypothetical protein